MEPVSLVLRLLSVKVNASSVSVSRVGGLDLDAGSVCRCIVSTYVGYSGITTLCLEVRCGVPWAGARTFVPT